MPKYNQRATPDQRWVCEACGRHTELGARRDSLHDSACVSWAVLCLGDKVDGKWRAIGHADELEFSLDVARAD
jgi:hypothetical protein